MGAEVAHPLSVRPELVEGLPFFLERKGQGLDKLGPNGMVFDNSQNQAAAAPPDAAAASR